jgi:hypothetical protein
MCGWRLLLPALRAKMRRNLERKLAQPGFADAIRCWLPSDDLKITYSHRGNGRDWEPIQQGSQGQRASALLAFLLSFGDGPLVLDQPEDDLDNKLISELVVAQIRANKMRVMEAGREALACRCARLGREV